MKFGPRVAPPSVVSGGYHVVELGLCIEWTGREMVVILPKIVCTRCMIRRTDVIALAEGSQFVYIAGELLDDTFELGVGEFVQTILEGLSWDTSHVDICFAFPFEGFQDCGDRYVSVFADILHGLGLA